MPPFVIKEATAHFHFSDFNQTLQRMELASCWNLLQGLGPYVTPPGRRLSPPPPTTQKQKERIAWHPVVIVLLQTNRAPWALCLCSFSSELELSFDSPVFNYCQLFACMRLTLVPEGIRRAWMCSDFATLGFFSKPIGARTKALRVTRPFSLS